MEKKTVNKSVLRHLDDNCGGGFILFTFDDGGIPQVDSNFSSNTEALAMQYYVQNWAKAMEAGTIEEMARSMFDQMPPDEEPEEGEI